MASINFTGLASGLDTRAIIDAILDAERQPVERLQTRQSLFSEKRAALDELGSKLRAFQSSLADLSSFGTFRGRVSTVSDEAVLRATAAAGAETGLFDIEVSSLAAAHKVKSSLPSAANGVVSDGTITLRSGSNEEISIDVSAANFNNDLNSIRDAINDADAGVQASIIFNGTENQLTVRAEESGTENALVIGDSTNLDLGGGGALVTAAADAQLSVDGIDVTSSSNRVAGIVPGVTLDLLKTNVGSPVTVGIEQDLDRVVEATQELVSQYNELIGFFNTQNSREKPGPLSGDSVARSVQNRIQSLFTGGLAGIPTGQIRSLASLGVDFDGKTGEATLDTAELRELLDSNFSGVGDLFLDSGRASDPAVRFQAAASTTQAGEYAVEITSAAEQASVTGQSVITKLRRDEDLTITVGADQVVVELSRNDELPDIIDTINQELQNAGIAAFADDDGGRLRISTNDYGSDTDISVESSRNNPFDIRQSGFSRTPSTDVGADLAGKIDGIDALVSGNVLTAAEGTDAEGLRLTVVATAAAVAANGGDFGTVSYSRGLIGTIRNNLTGYTRAGDGTIETAREVLSNGIERISDDIERFEDRLLIREARLIRSFTAAERAISLLQGQQAQFNAF